MQGAVNFPGCPTIAGESAPTEVTLRQGREQECLVTGSPVVRVEPGVADVEEMDMYTTSAQTKTASIFIEAVCGTVKTLQQDRSYLRSSSLVMSHDS